jgi:hypothetical protein
MTFPREGGARPAPGSTSPQTGKTNRPGILPARFVCARGVDRERGGTTSSYRASRPSCHASRSSSRRALRPSYELPWSLPEDWLREHRRTRDDRGDVPGTECGVASAHTRSKYFRNAQYPPCIGTVGGTPGSGNRAGRRTRPARHAVVISVSALRARQRGNDRSRPPTARARVMRNHACGAGLRVMSKSGSWDGSHSRDAFARPAEQHRSIPTALCRVYRSGRIVAVAT